MSLSVSTLERFAGNPILLPREDHRWETKAVFNPGAIYESGRVSLVYRAIGENEISVLGYASSPDGFHFDERLDDPVYVPREPWEGAGPGLSERKPQDSPYISGGGGMGGCEDPRLTRIDDRIYLTYVAYSGYSHPRAALSSIRRDDFLARKWDWKKPVLISPPDIIDKNVCILPERIDGKYVIFHRIYPDILIDYVDSLDFDGNTFLQGHRRIRPQDEGWDSHKVGAGPPPLKTRDGWLLIYHAVGKRDADRYKIGAMMLDTNDPSRVIARTAQPLLVPDVSYENDGWKSGVVYPCGSVIVKERLLVYYGAADRTVCVASMVLDKLLDSLRSLENIVVTPPPARKEAPGATGYTGRCFRCRARREIINGKIVLLKNGRLAVRGECARCGATMLRLVKG